MADADQDVEETPADRPHYTKLHGRWHRIGHGLFTPMPSGWRPGVHPPDVKP
jgi:hypothetical protein